MEASTSAVVPTVQAPRKRKFTEEDIEVDVGGGVRRRMERMSIDAENEAMVSKK
jgi:hypothetical protein